jgi:hypothetical protein
VSDIDEKKKMEAARGCCASIRVYTTEPFVHDHWGGLPASGDLIVGSDAQGKGGEPFHSPTYAAAAGIHHGPFKLKRAACCSKSIITMKAEITRLAALRMRPFHRASHVHRRTR